MRSLARHEGLTEQQSSFVNHLSNGSDPEAAATRAGYASPLSAYNLLRLPHVLAAVHFEIQRQLQIDAPVSLKVLREIRNDPKAPAKVRADISLKLLALAGHVKPETRDRGQTKQLADMSPDELRRHVEANQAEIDRLERELADRAKDVSAQDNAQVSPPAESNPLSFLD